MRVADGLFDGRPHVDQRVIVSGDRPFDEDDSLLQVDVDHLKVLGGDLLDAVLPRKLLVRVNAARRLSLPDGAGVTAVFVGAVRVAEATEIPPKPSTAATIATKKKTRA